MTEKNYTYDIAISFSDKDIHIAESISRELNRLRIKNYFYRDQNNAGANLKEETWKVYREDSRFALTIISKDYAQSKWSLEELAVIRTVNRGANTRYWIPLRIDATPVEGLTNDIVYLEWQGNALETAISLLHIVTGDNDAQGSQDKSPKGSAPNGGSTNNFYGNSGNFNFDQRSN